jgi:hypothetical protein
MVARRRVHALKSIMASQVYAAQFVPEYTIVRRIIVNHQAVYCPLKVLRRDSTVIQNPITALTSEDRAVMG